MGYSALWFLSFFCFCFGDLTHFVSLQWKCLGLGMQGLFLRNPQRVGHFLFLSKHFIMLTSMLLGDRIHLLNKGKNYIYIQRVEEEQSVVVYLTCVYSMDYPPNATLPMQLMCQSEQETHQDPGGTWMPWSLEHGLEVGAGESPGLSSS